MERSLSNALNMIRVLTVTFNAVKAKGANEAWWRAIRGLLVHFFDVFWASISEYCLDPACRGPLSMLRRW